MGDISFRVQTRCARHLEQSLEERKTLAKIVRNFYNTSSTYAHGRQMSATSKGNKPQGAVGQCATNLSTRANADYRVRGVR